ncbi:hypothetical protein K0M31_008509 [Melipona bicolor]|uniref:G-protein coupled receptors family 1 profile domain-containing protein n=1 Tax=Melipona bicolor TaxID=60889 RepID=A0AA40KKI8_9HYME|nr:hypothetical protein K0M31_008509 [Melipona bicolor]
MIWFASITINLGPTFLSGALAANTESGHNAPSCPLVHGPFRHYILNVLWIAINVICVALTLVHLRKLHKDLTKANVEAVKVALLTILVNTTGNQQTNAVPENSAASTNGGTPKRNTVTITFQEETGTNPRESKKEFGIVLRKRPFSLIKKRRTQEIKTGGTGAASRTAGSFLLVTSFALFNSVTSLSERHYPSPPLTSGNTSDESRDTPEPGREKEKRATSTGINPFSTPSKPSGISFVCRFTKWKVLLQRGGAAEEHRKMRNYLKRMEREGVQRVKMFLVITAAYGIFWGPLFFVTLVDHPIIGNPTGYEVTLHIAYIHAFVNPVLFLSLHRGLRQGLSEFFCGCCEVIASWILGPSIPVESVQPPRYQQPIEAVPSPPEPPLIQPNACPDLTDVALLKPPLPPTGKHLLDDAMLVSPDPWTLVSRSKSTSSVYEEDDISRRSSILLPPPPKLTDSKVNVSPTSSDLPSE